ncbi:MAG: hypothetical protein OXG23_03770, partial [Chloroflexi bacterium]|nr:hypothetical protein [Chloroflexota bacterium]
MDGTAIIADRLLGAATALLFAVVVWLGYRLRLGLIRPFQRLTLLVLIVIAALNTVSLIVQQTTRYGQWLWALDLEWNIASALSSTLLAITAGALLTAAWLVRKKQVAFGAYLLLVGLAVLYFAVDEYH